MSNILGLHSRLSVKKPIAAAIGRLPAITYSRRLPAPLPHRRLRNFSHIGHEKQDGRPAFLHITFDPLAA
jgi:hypothetical protein